MLLVACFVRLGPLSFGAILKLDFKLYKVKQSHKFVGGIVLDHCIRITLSTLGVKDIDCIAYYTKVKYNRELFWPCPCERIVSCTA